MSFDLPRLPEGWAFAPLEQCAVPGSISYGVVQPGAPVQTGVPIIRVNNFGDGRLDLSDVLRIAPEVESKYTRTRLGGGEVLLTLVGSVGQVAEVPLNCAGFNVARAVGVIKPGKDIEAKWLAICLRSPLSQHLLGSRANTTVQTTINLKDVRALPIPVPPAAERTLIAGMIGALDDRIALLRETNATLEAIAQALFKSWFVDFDPVRAKSQGLPPAGMDEATAALFPDGFEESAFGLVPRGWHVSTMNHLCSRVESGGTPKRSVPAYWQGGVPWLTSGEVRNPVVFDTKEMISELGMKESSAKLWPRGTTVVAMYGATAGEVCLLAEPAAANQACCGLVPKADCRSYLFFGARRERQNLASKSSGSAQQNLNKALVSGHAILVPSSPALSAYESSVGPLLDGWIESERRAQTLATLRDTLLPRLISGQLRLPEAVAEVEDIA